ncbi:sel1 repeat family protein, partial [Campylobacter lari]|nr:sel1 repeat family protein [Campylobacter lari]
SLGIIYEYGKGIKKDISKATEFYSRACDLKIDAGCGNYARLKQ